MFWKSLKTEFMRAFSPFYITLMAGLIVLVLIGSDWEMMRNLIKDGYTDSLGSIEILWVLLGADAFKCVMVLLLASLYTSGFCKDVNSKYLRMILVRTDITIYTQCKFIANLCVILVTSMISFYAYILIMSLWVPLVPAGGEVQNGYYIFIATNYPLIYVGMAGFVFGLVAAACSSVGMLYSSYKSNSFVSIALSGLVFFVAVSYIPYGSPFNLNGIVGMSSNQSEMLSLLWAIVYPLFVIGICGLMFWRRIKRMVKNGYI